MKRESDPGIYGGAANPAATDAGFAEWMDSGWSPGRKRARARTGHGEPFIDVVPTRVEGPAAGASTRGGFDAGARVFHAKFGYGTVRAVNGDRLTIAFDKAGEKKVMAGFVVPEDQVG